MASLERIDKIKSELLSAKQSLHEADNWTLMTTDIEEVWTGVNDLREITNNCILIY
jgi:Golgi complex component 7 (COG7).